MSNAVSFIGIEFGSKGKASEAVKDVGKSLIQPFKPDIPEAPKAPEIPGAPKEPTAQDPAIQAAVDQQRKRLRAARGRSSTILTRGTTLGEPDTRRKTILGG